MEEASAELQGVLRSAKTKEEIETLEKDIRSIGNYSYVTTNGEWKEALRDPSKMDGISSTP